MTDIAFTPVEKPATIRPTKENPFADAVASLLDDGKPTDRALSFTITKVDAPDAKPVKSAQRLLRECGKPLGVTVRQSVTYDAKAKSATVTFWTVDRITHSDAAPEK